jgi:hypothetical protein
MNVCFLEKTLMRIILFLLAAAGIAWSLLSLVLLYPPEGSRAEDAKRDALVSVSIALEQVPSKGETQISLSSQAARDLVQGILVDRKRLLYSQLAQRWSAGLMFIVSIALLVGTLRGSGRPTVS